MEIIFVLGAIVLGFGALILFAWALSSIVWGFVGGIDQDWAGRAVCMEGNALLWFSYKAGHRTRDFLDRHETRPSKVERRRAEWEAR